MSSVEDRRRHMRQLREACPFA